MRDCGADDRRINELKRKFAEDPSAFDNVVDAPPDDVDPLVFGQPVAPPQLAEELSQNVFTTLIDPIRNRLTKLNDIRSSTQYPNKWRVHARVAALYPWDAAKGNTSYVAWYCRRCEKK